MDRVENCISFLINKAAQGVSRRVRDALSPHGVTSAQFAVLMVLWEQDGLCAAEIGTRLSVDSATLTGLIDRLEAATFLIRQACGDDRRVHRLKLTETGRAARPALEAAMDRVNETILAELGASAPVVWTGLRQLSDKRELPA